MLSRIYGNDVSVLLPSVLLVCALCFRCASMNKGGGGMMGVKVALCVCTEERPESHLLMLQDRMKPRNLQEVVNFFTIRANT